MFGFAKRKLFRRMKGYVDIIMLACYSKLWRDLSDQHIEREAKLLSAAITNRLFAQPKSPSHSHLSDELINERAIAFLQKETDQELLDGIVMSLRTRMVLETDSKVLEKMKAVGDTVQFVKSAIDLPPNAPNPEIMEQLAGILQSRYCQ